MTLTDLINALDDLSSEDLEQLQQQINIRRQQPSTPTDVQQLRQQIAAILQDADPIELVAGTMDVDKLATALEAMREGLTEQELDEIAEAMNAEYIEPDNKLNG